MTTELVLFNFYIKRISVYCIAAAVYFVLFVHQAGEETSFWSMLFFKKYSANVNIYTRTSTHPYKHTHIHIIPMSTFKRLSQFDIEIHEIDHQERITVDMDAASN
jgi:hypothetical protein